MSENNRYGEWDPMTGGSRSEQEDREETGRPDAPEKQDLANETGSEDRPAYFSYGPFAPGAEQQGERTVAPVGANEPAAYPASVQPDEPAVEITAPELPKPMPEVPESAKERKKRKKRERAGRSSFFGKFAAFMAGAVLVGSLMFAADKMNLFTADAAGSTPEPVRQTQTADRPAGGDSGVQNASLDIVRPNTIAEIVSNSQAAVVKIEMYSKRTSRSSSPLFNDPFFRFFFGDDYNQPEQSPSGRLYKTGEGSGFIFDSDGYILTNQHVVDGADEIRVFVEGYDDYFVAEKLGESYDLDLAAVKISGKEPFAYLKLGNADAMNVGDWVIAIGNPYGFDHTVTVGVLSAKERPITIRDGTNTRQYEHLLQTDASINPGNSGGPLLNLNGEVIGINTAVSAQAQGIGFAIPTSTITDVLDNLKNDKPIEKQPEPYIGVYLADLDDAWKQELGFKGDGALVTQVEVGGPANRAGLRAGDIITEVAGKKIASAADVSTAVKEQEVGKKITLKVVRDGKTYEAVVTVGNRNANNR